MRLARGCAGQVAAFQVGVLAGDAAGVDQYERPRLDQPADAVVAVAGDAGLGVHESIAGARQRIDQRRFNDDGTTTKGKQGEHGRGGEGGWERWRGGKGWVRKGG